MALTGGRESETVLRRAARIAKRSGSAELLALHVLRGDGLAGATAAEAEQFPANSTLGKIQERGEITIGVKFDVPPFGFENPQTNEVEGFDVDLGKYIAEHIGVEPKFMGIGPVPAEGGMREPGRIHR